LCRHRLLLFALLAVGGCATRDPHVTPDLPFPLTTTWRVPPTPLPDAAAQHPIVGPLVTDGEAVFFTTDAGVVRALELPTGETRWEVSLAPGVLSVSGGTVFLRRGEGGVDALDAKAGAILWQSHAGSPGDLPAASDGEHIVVLGRAATLLSARSGEKIWTTRGLGTFSTAPLFAKDRVVAGTREGAIHCIELATGKPLWTYQTQAPVLAAPVADDSGRVFLGTGDGRLLALSLRSGKRIWEWKTGVATDFPALCYKDVVLFVPSDAVVMALRRNTGHLAWRAVIPSRPLAPPMLHDDVLLIACYGSRENRTALVALDIITTRRLGGTFETQGETTTPPLFMDDRLVFAFRDRSVALLTLAKTDEALGKGLARRRRLRDLGAEGTPTPTPAPRR
jgi:outer membrane protein assembly factor BamB